MNFGEQLPQEFPHIGQALQVYYSSPPAFSLAQAFGPHLANWKFAPLASGVE